MSYNTHDTVQIVRVHYTAYNYGIY